MQPIMPLAPWVVTEKTTPHRMIEQMAEAMKSGHLVNDLLMAKASALRMETERRSLPQVASALRCWHHFAVAVLGYLSSRTLPLCGECGR